MQYTEEERISHVMRRLGFGAEPDRVAAAADVDEAIATALDTSADNPEPPRIESPDDAREPGDGSAGFRWWLEMLVSGPRRIEERMTWFWHDHFATDARKVQFPHLLVGQHLTIREHALGSFADLLFAMATDPAMLIYLDGRENSVEAPNENFGREVLELHTVGRGNFTEADVVAASRSFSGWVVVPPDARARDILAVDPWAAVFVPFRHDSGSKTLFGVTGRHDAAAAVEIILDRPETAAHIARKVYLALVGIEPDEITLSGLAATFRRDYRVRDLVEAIAADPVLISDQAIRVKKRTPLEQAIGVLQGFGLAERGDRAGRAVVGFLQASSYLPFRPPNPAGYPEGARLLGPYALVHTFDLVAAVPDRVAELSLEETTQRLGLFDLSDETAAVLEAVRDPALRLALLINSPEYHLV